MRRKITNAITTAMITILITLPVYASEPAAEPTEGTTLEEIGEWLIHIVIPREEYFAEKLDQLNNKLQEKLPYQIYTQTIGRLREITAKENAATIRFDYMGAQQEIDISGVIKPFKEKFQGIITGLYVLFFAYYNYRQIMHLIRGTNYANMMTGESGDAVEAGNRFGQALGKTWDM